MGNLKKIWKQVTKCFVIKKTFYFKENLGVYESNFDLEDEKMDMMGVGSFYKIVYLSEIDEEEDDMSRMEKMEKTFHEDVK